MNARASTLLILAIAAPGLLCSASAAGIDGVLSFPGEFVPAMTVYAREVDGSRLHSLATHESQTRFKFDLPPGHYTFFAEPSQPGAPQLYGAYTQFVVCKAHDPKGTCEDHALVPVSVGGAAAPEANPGLLIGDWSIPDDLANEIDHLLGNRGKPSAQELGAPRFSEYPAIQTEPPGPPALDFSLLDLPPDKQTRLREKMPLAADFAGTVAIVALTCGAGCEDFLLIDWRSGKVLAPSALARILHDLPCRRDETLLFRRDSRLLSLTRTRNGGVSTTYFIWKPESSTLVQTAEYQRAVDRFCAVPMPMP